MHAKSIILFWGVTKKVGGTKAIVMIPNPLVWVPSELVNVTYVMKLMSDGQKPFLSLIGWFQVLVPSSRPKQNEQPLNECLWLWVKVTYARMLSCEHVNVWAWAWTNEPKGIFLGISCWHRRNINWHIGQNI